MHALLITFHCEIPEEKLHEGMGAMMDAMRSSKGLVMKTFLSAGPQELGGFYLFDSKEASEAYIAGDFLKGFTSMPGISNVEVKHFDVEDEPSKALATPSAPLA